MLITQPDTKRAEACAESDHVFSREVVSNCFAGFGRVIFLGMIQVFTGGCWISPRELWNVV